MNVPDIKLIKGLKKTANKITDSFFFFPITHPKKKKKKVKQWLHASGSVLAAAP